MGHRRRPKFQHVPRMSLSTFSTVNFPQKDTIEQ